MQRKDEILAKKAKLAELRRQREERERKQKELSHREGTGEPSSEVSHDSHHPLLPRTALTLLDSTDTAHSYYRPKRSRQFH